MSNLGRKKQPELVRAQLLTAAAEEAVAKGLGAVTLEAVAKRAGVSKGGLLHHFPNRQVLMEGMYQSVLDRFGAKIESLMADDPDPAGRFSRAYLLATTVEADDDLDNRIMAVASLAMSVESTLAGLWRDWLDEKLKQSGEDIQSVTGHLVRLATDGLWLEDCQSGTWVEPGSRQAIIDRLITLSYEIEPATSGGNTGGKKDER